jgi:polyisoprenoid-binding protein YceI
MKFFLILMLINSVQAQVIAKIKLTPVGSFEAKSSEVTGEITGSEQLSAQKLIIKSSSLKTDIELRDKHLVEKIQSTKFPEITLLDITGKDGKAKGMLNFMGQTKPVDIDYTVKDKTVAATFKINLDDYGLTKISYMGIGVLNEVQISANLPLQ